MIETEIKAANTLLQIGVVLPIKPPLFFWFWKPKVYQPSLGNKVAINKLYLESGITDEMLENASLMDAVSIENQCAYAVCRMIAYCMFRGYLLPKALNKIVGRWLMYKLSPQQLYGTVQLIMLFSGTADFMSTTRFLRQFQVMGRKGNRS